MKYDEIVSSLLIKIEDYDFLSLTDSELSAFLTGWIHSAVSRPYIRRLFSVLTMDDDIETLTYEMKYEVDEDIDHDFVVELLALGAGVQWLTAKVNSTVNIHQQYGSKEEKFYSQSSHLSELRNLRKDWIKEQRGMIRDRGAIWNGYLDGGAS